MHHRSLKIRQASSLALGLALMGAAQTAAALGETCTVAGSGVAFGGYTPTSATALAGTGTITMTCSGLVSLLDSWTITLSAGLYGTFAARKMKTGSSLLSYNLYTSAAHSVVWGDGTAGTGVVSDTETFTIGTNYYYYTVYGLIGAMQDLPAGTYTDTITVTVNY
jgi:spore coat protein U-like protein